LNFNRLLKDRWLKSPDHIFLKFENHSFTYSDMWNLSNRLAQAFLDIGIRRGDRVAIIMDNRPEFIWSWFALSKIGAVAVTIDTRLNGTFLHHQLKNSECKTIITQTRIIPVLNQQEHVEELKPNSIVIVAEEEEVLLDPNVWNVPIFDYNQLAETEPAHDHSIAYDLPESWPLTIVYTSGTTGPAKGVVNPHGTFLLTAIDLGAAVAMNQSDRLFLFLPMFHANPQLMGMPAVLHYGATLVLGKKFSASAFWDTVSEYGITLFTYVGTVLTILDKVTPHGKKSTLRAAYGGGAPEQVWRSLEEKASFQIVEGYGMAEIGGLAICNTLVDKKMGSIGKVREAFDIRLFDDDDREVEIGEVGEIVVRPQIPCSMFTYYVNMEKTTLSAMRNLWFHTGDLARKDENGYYYFVSRKKNMIRKKGENISGYEIENRVLEHEKVLEAAVVPVPDEIAGEEIKLSVVCKPDAGMTYEELDEWIVNQLPVHMVPRYLNIRDSFIKTSSEKIQIQSLIDEGIQQVWDRTKKMEVIQ
jgi:crotonobetaine/carnitine-CoA ligase